MIDNYFIYKNLMEEKGEGIYIKKKYEVTDGKH